MTHRTRSSILLGLVVTFTTVAAAQQPEVRSDADLERLLAAEAGLDIDLPDLGYTWSDSSFTGTTDEGTFAVTATKVIYYFLHWGPIEQPEISEDYVRARIPRVWPDEGLEVRTVAADEVCGHPAYFAEVLPRRDFYRAFFMIWNCPESGRQFIADMNYNVQYDTPRSELEAEFATTRHTLACHPGAPTRSVPGHVATWEGARFGLRFDHPLHWFVNDSPYGVPHPEYRGIRSDRVGSLLANLQDTSTEIVFGWGPLPEETAEDRSYMGNSVAQYRAAILGVRGLDGVVSFDHDDAETFVIEGRRVFKLFGDMVREAPEEADAGARKRAMALVIDDHAAERRLQVVVMIGEHEVDGVPRRPVRDVFDRWALAVAEGWAP